MTIKINEFGLLEFKRKNKWRTAECPYSADRCCGDWCVFFGEPFQKNRVLSEEMKVAKFTILEICNKVFAVKEEDFIDERS